MRRNDWLTLGTNVSPTRRGRRGQGQGGGDHRMKNHRQSKCRYCGRSALSPVSASIRHCPRAGLSLSGPPPRRQLNFLKRSRHLIQLCSHYRFVFGRRGPCWDSAAVKRNTPARLNVVDIISRGMIHVCPPVSIPHGALSSKCSSRQLFHPLL